MCFHVDDMLGTGEDHFESKMKELDKLVGFGSMKRYKIRQLRENMPTAKSRFNEGIRSELEENWPDSSVRATIEWQSLNKKKIMKSEASMEFCNA